jgi:voltage-gated potassium channel Kch
MLKSLFLSYHRRRFAWLFFTLLLTLGIYPALKPLAAGLNLMELLLAVNLLAAIASLAPERHIRVLLWLGIAFVGVRGIQALFGIGAMMGVSEALWATASLLATTATARYALRPGVVDTERIFAALDAYLLAGLVFGVWYWVLEQIFPGSFAPASAGALDLSRALYFSFVTIATLGYGDIVPASEAARGVAILEAVGGQMYLAVLVARLVSLYGREADKRP